SVGIELPPYNIINFQEDVKYLDQGIVIVPPALADSKTIRKIPNMANAICSGWMQVRGSRRWRGADAGFAISDHADWPGLLDAIKATEAEKYIYYTRSNCRIYEVSQRNRFYCGGS